jgi:hypothetical protein
VRGVSDDLYQAGGDEATVEHRGEAGELAGDSLLGIDPFQDEGKPDGEESCQHPMLRCPGAMRPSMQKYRRLSGGR